MRWGQCSRTGSALAPYLPLGGTLYSKTLKFPAISYYFYSIYSILYIYIYIFIYIIIIIIIIIKNKKLVKVHKEKVRRKKIQKKVFQNVMFL